MIDNKILKHKYLFIFLVFAFSVLFGKLEVNAEESEYKRIHITTYYNQPGIVAQLSRQKSKIFIMN